PRCVPRCNRTQRDAIGRELEIEQRGAHAPFIQAHAGQVIACCKAARMEPKRSLWAVAYGFRIGGRSRSFIPMVPRFPVGAREITMLLPSAGSVAGKISMGIARCGETARSMNSTSPMLLSRLRQMIFTGLAYRSTQQHKTGEANGCR